jgi:hypothetical protein
MQAGAGGLVGLGSGSGLSGSFGSFGFGKH